MIFVQHLKQQLAELQCQYDICTERLAKLNMAHAIETDVLQQFKLERHIKAETTRREEIYQEIEVLGRVDAATKLYRALLKLNYIEQTKVFRLLTDVSHIGAFVIHGDQDYGQRWLLNRLVNQVLLTPGEEPISIVFSPRRAWNFPAVCREIGRQIGKRNPISLADIVEQLYSIWQQRPVVIIFRQIGSIHSDLLRDLLEKFWWELAKKATGQPVLNDQFKLFLFLVDDDGVVNTWPFKWAERVNSSWEPFMPIKFPRLTHILGTELKNWLDHEWDELPAMIRATPIEEILQQSEAGIPQLVLEHLCALSNCDWLEMEHQWIKH